MTDNNPLKKENKKCKTKSENICQDIDRAKKSRKFKMKDDNQLRNNHQDILSDSATNPFINKSNSRCALRNVRYGRVTSKFLLDQRMSNKVLGYHALVFEELDKSSSFFKQSFQLWRRRFKEKCVQKLDPSCEEVIQAVHIVYPSQFQIYFAKNLDCTPHYTITNENDLKAFIQLAQERKHLTIHEYLPNKNYNDPSNFLVIFNFYNQQEEQAAKFFLNLKNFIESTSFVKCCSQNLNTICPTRKIKSESRGFMEVDGSKWTRPYPFLSDFTDNKKLCKPGISGKLSQPIKSLSAGIAHRLGQLMMCMYNDFMPVYHDVRRRYECASILYNDLVADSTFVDDELSENPFVFEGVTVIQTCLNDCLEIHVDTLNDHNTEGYNITSVVCIWTHDTKKEGLPLRTGVVAYSRQSCASWMNRLRRAENTMQEGISAYRKLKWVKKSLFLKY